MQCGTGYTVSIYRNLPALSFQLRPPLKERAANSHVRFLEFFLTRADSRRFWSLRIYSFEETLENTIINEIHSLGGGEEGRKSSKILDSITRSEIISSSEV